MEGGRCWEVLFCSENFCSNLVSVSFHFCSPSLERCSGRSQSHRKGDVVNSPQRFSPPHSERQHKSNVLENYRIFFGLSLCELTDHLLEEAEQNLWIPKCAIGCFSSTGALRSLLSGTEMSHADVHYDFHHEQIKDRWPLSTNRRSGSRAGVCCRICWNCVGQRWLPLVLSSSLPFPFRE